MRSAFALRIISGKYIFIFAILENLRIFQNCLLTGGVATVNGICDKKQRPGFPHPSYGRWKTRAYYFLRYQLLALVSFTILAAGSLLMAELLRVLASWAP